MPKSVYTITALCCPAEEGIVRNSLGKLPGVTGLSFDLFNRRLTVEHTLPDDAAIVKALKSVGMPPVAGPAPAKPAASHSHGPGACCDHDHGAACATPAAGKPGHDHDHGRDHDHKHGPDCKHEHDDDAASSDVPALPAPERRWLRHGLLALSGVLAFGSEVAVWTTGREQSAWVIAMAVASVLLGGLPVLKKGWIALRTFTLNINFLMTVAVIGAAFIGSWAEAAMVLFLFALAELIEAYSLERARNAVRALMTLTPDSASVKNPDGSWTDVPAEDVPVGATVRVKPGERIALDGKITSGASAVDQAPITGESIPVEKGVGDALFAGTINGHGLLEFTTTGGKDDTTLARIIKTVQEAQGQRAPTQRFVDSFARVYTPIVCLLALLVAVVPPLAFAQPWFPWIYKALVLLVVGCPCALVISTPVTIVSGLAAAARRGILIKGGVYLEQGRSIKIVALDKTGTITEGKPKVTTVRPLDALSPDQVLRLAASLDAGSDHPVARAVFGAWDPAKVAAAGPLLPVSNFTSVTGRGVKGTIDGRMYYVGNHRFAHERGVCTPTVESALHELEALGQTAIVLTDERQALGVIAVADTPRATSIEALRELHDLGIKSIMLSGDNQTTAEAIARSVGIDDARGNLLPEDKLKAIDTLLAQYGQAGVGMVGDGVNDAPALAKSSIGFAMGAAGTDTALETADVALMRDDLRGVPEFVALSRRTSAILVQNITFAIATKAVFFGLAVVGIATMWMAVVADVGATMLVIANGLRVMRGSRVPHTPHPAPRIPTTPPGPPAPPAPPVSITVSARPPRTPAGAQAGRN